MDGTDLTPNFGLKLKYHRIGRPQSEDVSVVQPEDPRALMYVLESA